MNQRGQAIVTSLIALTFLAIVAVMMTRGTFSTLQFKRHVDQRVSLNSVEDAIVGALTVFGYYQNIQPGAAISSATCSGSKGNPALCNMIFQGTGSLVVGTAGTLVPFYTSSKCRAGAGSGVNNATDACDLFGSSDSTTVVGKAIQDCLSINSASPGLSLPPASNSALASQVFCLSTARNSVAGNSNFFGTAAGFLQFKVNFIPVTARTVSALSPPTTTGGALATEFQWGAFVGDSNPWMNYQAQVTYSIFWGNADDSNNFYQKDGFVVTNLQ